MAYEIFQPDVGTTMIRTFSAISEHNRKRQADEQRLITATQNQLIANAGMDLRERALNLRGVQASNNYVSAQKGLEIRERDSDTRARAAELKFGELEAKHQTQAEDERTAKEIQDAITMPAEDGMSLNQRALSTDPAIAQPAIAQISEIIVEKGKLGGKVTNNAIETLQKTWKLHAPMLKEQIDKAKLDLAERRLLEQQKNNEIRNVQNETKITAMLEKNAGIAADRAKAFALKAKSGVEVAIAQAFPEGETKLNLRGAGQFTINKIRIALGRGGPLAETIKKALKSDILDALGVPTKSPYTDEAIERMEKEGKTALDAAETLKALGGSTETPAPASRAPAGTAPGSGTDKYLLPAMPSDPHAPPTQLNPGAPSGAQMDSAPANEFFGLPRPEMFA